ncbi:MAG: RNA polymerase subunit sigma [Sphingomonas sp. 32-66-10]|nr:MAG: RNA polymerase subunit sigma [Sphingomonas sp. 32-66-10]
MFFVANALIGLVGLVAALAVIRMAGPRVGARQDGARWLLAALAILPMTAVILAAIEGQIDWHEHATHGLECFVAGTGSGALVAVALVAWLRRGAPVTLNIAGFYTGVATGALGSFAYGLTCPVDSIGHLGIWHVAPVALSAALGRFIVPHWVRW